ncbi:MAG: pirin family protein [Gammaproteobacteria bacterium]|nr:pirin family protein [Gammaproteobacteria bacterium]
MITLRKANERGLTQTDWLESWHTFSFDTYYSPQHTHFRNLRVINQDVVAPGAGFGMHAHNNMEIITYVIRGTLTHKDSMGNEAAIRPGEIQIMSAGTGVQHSEFNASQTEPVELLQIWIFPNEKSLVPSYQQKSFIKKENALTLLVDSAPTQSTVTIHQDIKLYVCKLSAGLTIDYEIMDKHYLWLQIIKGEFLIDTLSASAGDGVAVNEQTKIKITAQQDGELLLFVLS